MGFIKNTFKGIGKAALGAGQAFMYTQKQNSSVNQKGKDGKFADRYLDKSGYATINDFRRRVKEDKKGDFYKNKLTAGFSNKKRENLSSEVIEGMKKIPGALKHDHVHSEDFKKAYEQFKMGKYGAYKDYFAPGKEIERKELGKTLEALSKTVPYDASKNT
jgi:hypothetical protein